jgi:protein MBA1
MCLSGVAAGFRDRIAARPQGVSTEWRLNESVGVKTRIVSNRASMLSISGYDDTGVQQIVFRMQSNQGIEYRRGGKKIEGSQEGQVIEYLVLQRQMLRGAFKEWKVWGFANEWDLETVEEDAQQERDINAFQGSQTT